MRRPSAGLEELLAERGVTDRESRVYLAAVRGGPRSSSALAGDAGLGRLEGYRAVQALLVKGYLRPTSDRPRRFEAIPPEELVERWSAQAKASLRRLRLSRPRIRAEFAPQDGGPGSARDPPPTLSILRGHSAVLDRARAAFRRARRTVLMTGGAVSLGRMETEGLTGVLMEAQRRGVRVQFLTPIAPANLPEARRFAQFGELRHLAGPTGMYGAVVDGRWAMLRVPDERDVRTREEEDLVVCSSQAEFVVGIQRTLRSLWKAGTPWAERLAELERRRASGVGGRRPTPAEQSERLVPLVELALRATGLSGVQFDAATLASETGRNIGREVASAVRGISGPEVADSLADFYATHAPGRLRRLPGREPLTLEIRDCFACLQAGAPEAGRAVCPEILRGVFEHRLGGRWAVSVPDPLHHAQHGCQFRVVER